jgi:hypothetical protein
MLRGVVTASALYPAASELRAGVEDRLLRLLWPIWLMRVVMVAVAIAVAMITVSAVAILPAVPIGRGTAPIGGGSVVDRLRELAAVVLIFLPKRIVLIAQLRPPGCCIGKCLLLFALLRGQLLGRLALGLFVLGLLVGLEPLPVELVEVAGFGVLPGQLVLSQTQVLIDHFRVVGLVQ